MEIYVYWFLFALVLLGVEMASGTFYLLVLSAALAIGGLTALLGLALPVQFVLAGLSGVVGTIVLRRWKSGRDSGADSQNLDAGQPVRVISRHDDGSLRVFYRGAEWDAELEPADIAGEGTLCIKAIRGSVLILEKRKPG